ncbi:DUF1642 domain-containing protein [Streptococcus gallolyticus]|uniref:DUF1642 domain-containing protein n=1 Tax=Streptococcus gallolyticus TaxID=315405 RepID=UPI001F42D923|nr:DUF1642 domain-containing protein [Streptococcus gallolyticus]MCF1634330.1 DUF1642 domain-containing protein [Streptococcus gallolyticus]
MMNKQEAIKKIEKEKSNLNAWEDLTRNRALDDALAIFKRLDEPKKPVVPRFVADWYEEHKEDLEYNLYRLCIDFCGRKLHEDLHEWFKFDKNKPIETLILMHKFGYEVQKKEKLYTAQLKSTGEFLHYNKETDKVHHFCAYGNTARNSKNYHFTEDTLIQYNAWGNDAYDVNEVDE